MKSEDYTTQIVSFFDSSSRTLFWNSSCRTDWPNGITPIDMPRCGFQDLAERCVLASKPNMLRTPKSTNRINTFLGFRSLMEGWPEGRTSRCCDFGGLTCANHISVRSSISNENLWQIIFFVFQACAVSPHSYSVFFTVIFIESARMRHGSWTVQRFSFNDVDYPL